MTIAATTALRSGPRPSTSRHEIVQCAIRMLDREGPGALTFRAVARELDIAVGALSRYFKNLADLEDEVAAQIMSELRPLDSNSKRGLRDQLLRFGIDLLEIHRAHPYLLTIHGPASAAVIARHMKRSLEALLKEGLDFERALAIYSMVGSLPYAWGAQTTRQQKPELQAQVSQAFSEQMDEYFPKMEKLLTADTTATLYRRWFLFYIDAMLSASPAAGKGL
ncbi:MAG: TetR/AcrR family transcriptional regulator [Stenotrophobium sp.]